MRESRQKLTAAVVAPVAVPAAPTSMRQPGTVKSAAPRSANADAIEILIHNFRIISRHSRQTGSVIVTLNPILGPLLKVTAVEAAL